MTGDAFEAAIDRIIATESGHAAHSEMDRLTNEVLTGLGGGYARGAAKWLAAIDGYHAIAIETRRAETGTGSVHESAGLQGIAQPIT